MTHARLFTAVWLVWLAVPVWSAEVQQFRGEGPSRVLMQTVTGDTCATANAEGVTAMSLTFGLPQRSHLWLSFTFEWGSLALGEEGLLAFTMDGGSTAGSSEWGFSGTDITRTSGTLTWAFANIPAGKHTVAVGARVEGGDTAAELNDCGFTVMVIERE
jgi:hypothetical protein